jgi:predicted dehydrogenase
MINVGIIGSGFGLYGLLPAFITVKNCRVVAFCGKQTPRVVTYCQSIGLKNFYTNWQKMLENENLDAIVIAVTPQAQYEIAKAAINKGLHVFAEKPLAATLLQAEELYTLAKKKKIVHVVDFIFPQIKEWEKVKEIIDKKIYGNVTHISVNWDFFKLRYKKIKLLPGKRL